MYFYFEEQDDEVTCKMVCVTDNGLYNAWETVYYLLLYKVLQTFWHASYNLPLTDCVFETYALFRECVEQWNTQLFSSLQLQLSFLLGMDMFIVILGHLQPWKHKFYDNILYDAWINH